MGGSVEGFLIGAVVNMRPDLYKGAIAAVLYVDVVTTMLDDSIPVTTEEYDEGDNPNDPEYREYLLSHSTYKNISEQAYPDMLTTWGLHGSQVTNWEPIKMHRKSSRV
jgi:oligopeptidase B